MKIVKLYLKCLYVPTYVQTQYMLHHAVQSANENLNDNLSKAKCNKYLYAETVC